VSEYVARTRLAAPSARRPGALLLIERNVMVYRRTWMILFSGFFEPLFYLFFFVYPLERFIGEVTSNGDQDGASAASSVIRPASGGTSSRRRRAPRS